MKTESYPAYDLIYVQYELDNAEKIQIRIYERPADGFFAVVQVADAMTDPPAWCFGCEQGNFIAGIGMFLMSLNVVMTYM